MLEMGGEIQPIQVVFPLPPCTIAKITIIMNDPSNNGPQQREIVTTMVYLLSRKIANCISAEHYLHINRNDK